MRLPITFNEKLPLRRAALSSVLKLSIEEPLTRERVEQETTLGKDEIDAIPKYLRAVGMLDNQLRVTPFGVAVQKHDLYMERLETQWLMHYFLVAPQSEAPEYWPYSAKTALRLNMQSNSEQLGQAIQESIVSEGKTPPVERTLQAAATCFLRAYANPEALGSLNILSEQGKEYIFNSPVPIPWQAVAFALADYWQGMWGAQNPVLYSHITGEDGLAGLLLLNSGEMGQPLTEMRKAGLLTIERNAHPWTVVRIWDRPEDVLKIVY